jgi:anti-sigma regulatory factor (Ser/Thr protein kinase)
MRRVFGTAQLDLPRRPAAVSTARVAVRALLARCGLFDSEYGYEVELTAAEIVTNAVQHVGGPVWVDMSVDDGGVTVAASDACAQRPVIGGPDGRNGRGLLIVDALSAAWGSHDMPDGKRVWAYIVR